MRLRPVLRTAQLRLAHWNEAMKGLQWMIGKNSRKEFSATPAFVLVSLARAQAGAGQVDAARKTYQEFFKMWKDADPDVPMLVTAKEEFAKISGSP